VKQSLAEQSRAEQSRAEQSRAAVRLQFLHIAAVIITDTTSAKYKTIFCVIVRISQKMVFLLI